MWKQPLRLPWGEPTGASIQRWILVVALTFLAFSMAPPSRIVLLATDSLSAESVPASAIHRTVGRSSTSGNFVVVATHPDVDVEKLVVQCEDLRSRLRTQWLPTYDSGDWKPRCEVVVHRSEAEYLRQVGMQAAMTRGCCKIDIERGRVIRRRLDLLVDPETGEFTALAHELTHVVLADRFAGKQLPRWADEGMALLADGNRKRALHLRHLHRAIARDRCPRVRDVLASHRYPPAQQLNAFYGQSLSMVCFLSTRDEPAKIVELLAMAMEQGFDNALRRTYAIDGAVEFERQWREYAHAQAERVAQVSIRE